MTVPLGTGDGEGHVPQGDGRHQGLCPMGRGMPRTTVPMKGTQTVLSLGDTGDCIPTGEWGMLCPSGKGKRDAKSHIPWGDRGHEGLYPVRWGTLRALSRWEGDTKGCVVAGMQGT